MSAAEIEQYEKLCRFTYALYSQDEWWFPKGRPRIAVKDMDQEWRYNTAQFIRRRAAIIAHRYSFGELLVLSTATYRGLIGEEDGKPVYGRTFSELDLMPDSVADDFDNWHDAMLRDPEAWIGTTPLYRALVAGLPRGKKKRQALADRAKHWAACPARSGGEDCQCERLSAAARPAGAGAE